MTASSVFKDKSILITGGTGSFGRAFAKHLLKQDEIKKVIILSRDEWKQWEIQQSDPIYRSQKIRFFLGDIRDPTRLVRAFNEVHYIVHAAALKQVPAAEYNPSEFVKTNVIGAMNIIDAAVTAGVQKVIALSTDKSVNPINLYGATKLCSDKLFCAGNVYVGARGFPKFSVVRYGNVLASRGSIIPLWKKMIDDGAVELPVTDARMTRFWITLDQAIAFVMKCFEEMRGGEIFVPKIPSMQIVELAQAMAPHLPHKMIGIRPGEKLHELLISIDEGRHSLEFDDHYVIIPEIFMQDPVLLEKFLSGRKGKPVREGFAYTSDTNTEWLKADQLQTLLTN